MLESKLCIEMLNSRRSFKFLIWGSFKYVVIKLPNIELYQVVTTNPINMANKYIKEIDFPVKGVGNDWAKSDLMNRSKAFQKFNVFFIIKNAKLNIVDP